MNNIDEEAEDLMAELTGHIEQDTPKKPLFHYTSFDGLCGILKARRLWLTDHSFLNDPSEIKHSFNLIKKQAEKIFKENGATMNNLGRNFFDFLEKSPKIYKAYLCSFCDKGDYLPAWRYYGGEGAGFSIGFKQEYFQPKHENSEGDVTLIFKIIYENGEIELINKMINTFFKKYNTLLAFEIHQEDDLNKILTSCLISNLFTIIPKIKNPEYKDEHEWRICMIKVFHNNLIIPSPPSIERFILSEANNKNLSPFLKNIYNYIPRFESEQFEYSDIDTIYVGPRNDYFSAKFYIQKFLLAHQIDKHILDSIKIEKSKKPYQ